MKIDRRELAGGPRTVLFIAESEDESQIFDWAFGNQVVDSDGLIAYVVGQVRLADGYADHYVRVSAPRKEDRLKYIKLMWAELLADGVGLDELTEALGYERIRPR